MSPPRENRRETPRGRPPRKRRVRRLPRGVWMLGFVSLFMDISSEIIHSILPMFLVGGLGLAVLSVGVIEGLADATAQVTKAFSGALSDRLGKRKVLAVAGYGLAAVTKPMFPLATSGLWVLTARFVDRLGKGIRGAPRDALIADIVPGHLRGASYGLRQALDTVGALAGPLLAAILLAATQNDFRIVMWAAVVPAFVSVGILVFGVREPPVVAPEAPGRLPRRPRELAALGGAFWALVAIASGLLAARFAEAFMLLRADGLGLGLSLVPLVLVAMNVVFAASSFPAGAVSDRVGRKRLVAIGFGLLVFAHLVLAYAGHWALVFVGAGLWGLHMGLTQGILVAMVADVAPVSLRGTAFGLFHMMTGLAMLVGSVTAGWLWDAYGAAVPFAVGAAVAAAAVVALLFLPVAPVPALEEKSRRQA